jgi:zinc protease
VKGSRALGALALLLPLLAAPAAPAAPPVLEATLDNGLRVLLLEDHGSPVVAFQVWYRVGSRNERPGATGLAHLLEHMMFKGTPTHGPRAFSALVEASGGADNAFTTQDHTAYLTTVPADRVDLVVALEADRMQNLLLDPKEFEAERQVVMEERRTRSEDDPQGVLAEELSALAFRAHPYRAPVIGWMEDLRRLTLDELRAFYRTSYVPNNALVVAVGAFEAPALLETIRARFGPIPRGPAPPPVTAVEPPQRGERRVTVRKEAQLPLVFVGYPVPTHRSPDAPALALLSTILSEGRRSRLPRRLVQERQVALEAGGDYPYFSADPNLFWFYATALPGQSAEALERALLEEVDRLAQEPLSPAELERAKNQVEAGFLFQQDAVGSRASLLARFELAGGWRLRDGYLPAIRSVTAEEIQRVARTFFTEARRNVGVLLPLPPSAE